MGAKAFTIAFDAAILNQDGMRSRILNLEDDLKGELVWREKIADVSGFDDGEDKITVTVHKKRCFSRANEVIKNNIKHHLSELEFISTDGCYVFNQA